MWPFKKKYSKKQGNAQATQCDVHRLTTHEKMPPSLNALFRELGPSLFALWESCRNGQNEAVKIFHDFKAFEVQLRMKYSSIDFNRFVYSLNIADHTVQITAGQCMYLYSLNLDQDCYFAIDDDSNVAILTHGEYVNIMSYLLEQEKQYCDELERYLKENISPLVNEVHLTRYGIESSEVLKRPIPINTKELHDYHRYIAEKEYFFKNNEYERWNRIYKSPVAAVPLGVTNNFQNPLILSDIVAVSAFVLDYICYATMALPCLDWDRVLLYRTPGERSVRETLAANCGHSVVEYIEKTITDMNCSMFRETVYSGLLLE